VELSHTKAAYGIHPVGFQLGSLVIRDPTCIQVHKKQQKTHFYKAADPNAFELVSNCISINRLRDCLNQKSIFAFKPMNPLVKANAFTRS